MLGTKIVHTEGRDLLKKGRFEVDYRRAGSFPLVTGDMQCAFKTLWTSGLNMDCLLLWLLTKIYMARYFC